MTLEQSRIQSSVEASHERYGKEQLQISYTVSPAGAAVAAMIAVLNLEKPSETQERHC